MLLAREHQPFYYGIIARGNPAREQSIIPEPFHGVRQSCARTKTANLLCDGALYCQHGNIYHLYKQKLRGFLIRCNFN